MSRYVSGSTLEYVSELIAEEMFGHHVLQTVFITCRWRSHKGTQSNIALFVTRCEEFFTPPNEKERKHTQAQNWVVVWNMFYFS